MCTISAYFNLFDVINVCDGAMGEAQVDLIILSPECIFFFLQPGDLNSSIPSAVKDLPLLKQERLCYYTSPGFN